MDTIQLLGSLILYPLLLALATIDLHSFRLPDRLTLPLLAAGILWSAAATGGWPVQSVIGAVLGYGLFAGLGWAFFHLRHEEGLGLGDAKLVAAGAAWLGAGSLPALILLAATGALVWQLVRPKRSRQIAFGPWLCLAIALVWTAQSTR